MKSFFFALFVLVSMQVTASQAAEVVLEATSYSGSRCGYFSTSLADFRFVLKERFADGARVRVRFGFLNAWAAEHHWQDIQEIEMHAISPDTWVATHQGQTVDLRGGFHFSHIEFAFLVVHPNGTVLWRNGGSNMGYYSAPIPKSSCARGELEVQPVETVKK